MFILIIVLAISLEYTYTSLSSENQQLKQQLNQSSNEMDYWKQLTALYSYDNLWQTQAYQSLGGVQIFFVPSIYNPYPAYPPVSGSQAVAIALQSGGWNLSSLGNAMVDVEFGSAAFQPNQTFWTINESYGPISSYAPVQNGSITYSYVWAVDVGYNKSSPFGTYHTDSYYIVDADTSEVFHATGFDITLVPVNVSSWISDNPYLH